MAVNQIGAGGLQNVSLYRQNQDNTPLAGQEPGRKPEEIGGGASFKVELSQESVNLSQRNQGPDLENQTQRQEQNPAPQQPQTTDTRQANSGSDPLQTKIDLFA